MFRRETISYRLQIKTCDELSKLAEVIDEVDKTLTDQIIQKLISKVKAILNTLPGELKSDATINRVNKILIELNKQSDVNNILEIYELCDQLLSSRQYESFYLFMQGNVPNSLFIFLIGSYKTGKSFLTEKILNQFNKNSPGKVDEVINTTGELLYDVSKGKILVDTEGLNQIVSNMRTEFMKMFTLEHACKLGKIIVYVIDKFTVFESKEIVNLMNMIRRNRGIELIIVHNMRAICAYRNLLLYKRQVKNALRDFNPQDRGDNFQISFHQYIIFNLFLGNQNQLSENNKQVYDFLSKKIEMLGGVDENYNKSVQWVVDQIELSQGFENRQRTMTEEVTENKNTMKFESGRSSIIKIRKEMFNPYLPRSDWYTKVTKKGEDDVVQINFNLPFYKLHSLRIELTEDMKFQINYTQLDPVDTTTERNVSEVIYIAERVVTTPKSQKWTNENIVEREKNNIVTIYLLLQGMSKTSDA